ncbi:NADH:ubiquinone dehydrogenase subunit 5 [Datura stramonium]|uniref:NADH:ubiquinone dehydrogenase subunit 5 n=1 Tax=Datura stramonium TaxID=4076 RepID=A0ABS8SZ82_DATST|nr:NADH:ubiquinone dehydrogenase subunit 5 [Datura stramonium]
MKWEWFKSRIWGLLFTGNRCSRKLTAVVEDENQEEMFLVDVGLGTPELVCKMSHRSANNQATKFENLVGLRSSEWIPWASSGGVEEADHKHYRCGSDPSRKAKTEPCIWIWIAYWSPDAMEGPTLVFALIHATTMYGVIDYIEGQAWAKDSEQAESMCSNFWPYTNHPMDNGLNNHYLKGLCIGDRCPFPNKVHLAPMGRYNYPHFETRKDKQTHSVDCRATSPTTDERDSLKSQGHGWLRGPTWRIGISIGNAKVGTSRPAKENQLV